MELVSRYLQAVRFWLPRSQQNDIVRELSEDLMSEIEARESALGRTLTEPEIADVLKSKGHPFLVATRFLPDQEWMGQPWMQLYRLVMRIVLLWVVLPILAIVYVPAIVTSRNPAETILASWGPIVMAIFFSVGAVTVGFGVVRWLYPDIMKQLDGWDPLKLPAPRDTYRISRFGSIIEVFVGLVFIAWWMDIPHVAIVNYASAAGKAWVVPSTWQRLHGDLYWPVVAVVAAGLVLSAVNFFTPRWTKAKIGVRIGIDGAVSLMSALTIGLDWAKLMSDWSIMQSANHGASKEQVAMASINVGIGTTLAVMAIICGWTAIANVVKIRRWDDPGAAGKAESSFSLQSGSI